MPKVGYIQNGVTKAKNGRRKGSTKRRKRNPAKATVRVKRRNGTTKAGAASYAKKNGLRLVSAANPKHKKRKRRTKRNGVVAVARSRNGILGNSKHDVRQVIGLLGGMGATKVLARIASNFASPYIAQLGIGRYTELLMEAGVALFVVPLIAKKIGTGNDAQNARLGGLAVAGLSAIDTFGGPSLSFLNPFNSSPVVMANGQPLLTSGAAAQIAAAAAGDAARTVTNALSGVPMGMMARPMQRISPLYD